MTIIEQPTPTREAICPDWCAGHNDEAFQSWEIETATGRPIRNHSSNRGAVVSNTVVDLFAEETIDGLRPATVSVFTDCTGDDELTPAQARQLAAALLDAADVIEGRQ
jgi:hypothetical protein